MKRVDLTPEEKGEAQRLAALARHLLGTKSASKKLRVLNSTLYRWSMGTVSPTKFRFEQLKSLIAEYKDVLK